MQGTVSRALRDYGFLQPEDGSGAVFYHVRDFERAGLAPPKVGDVITFNAVPSPKGRKVANLARAE